MLFLGTEKFPQENYYKQFLNQNGGSSNAMTSMEHTTYFFDINYDKFEPALDIFSQFFKNPLLSPNATSRELRAVDAEDSKNRILDGRRVLQTVKSLIKEDHPYSKFSTGNANTLADGNPEVNAEETQAAMKTFFRTHYRANKMAVTIVGPQPLQQLEYLARKHFEDIPSSVGHAESSHEFAAGTSSFNEHDVGHPFLPSALGTNVRLRPVQEVRDMSIMWPVPAVRDLYRRNPVDLLSYILNSKGENSAFAYLQDKNWVSSITAGSSVDFFDFSVFEVSASLTPLGMQHWEDVRSVLFAQIAMVRQSSTEELSTIWEEIRAAGALSFEFEEKSSPSETAHTLAKRMHQYPLEHILSVGSILDEFDESLTRNFLQNLTVSECITLLRSPDFDWLPLDDPTRPPDRESWTSSANGVPVGHGPSHWERWYSVPYHVEKISDSQKKSCEAKQLGYRPCLHLPRPNPFLPTELIAMCKSPNSPLYSLSQASQRPLRSLPPTECDRTEVSAGPAEDKISSRKPADSLWISQDVVFMPPKGQLTLLLRTQGCGDGDPVLSLFGSVFAQRAIRSLSGAGYAGIGYGIAVSSRGVGLSVHGFFPKLPELARRIAQDVGNISFWEGTDETLLANIKERSVRSLKSWWKQRPDIQADTLLAYLMQEGVWLPDQKLRAAEGISYEAFLDQARFLFTDPSGDLTVHVHRPAQIWDVDRVQDAQLKTSVTAIGELLRSSRAVKDPVTIPEPSQRSRLLPRPTSTNSRASVSHTTIAMPVFNTEEVNSALLCFFQGAPTSPRNSALLIVLRRLIGEPLFSELRTKQQLGYIVSLSIGGFGRGLGSVRGLSVKVLSQRFSPTYMQRALGQFLTSQKQEIAMVTQAQLSALTDSIVKSLEDPPLDYAEEADSFWGHIVDETPFDWTAQVIAELKSLSVADVVEAADRWVFDAQSRASVSVMLFGKLHLDELQELRTSKGTRDEKDEFSPSFISVVGSQNDENCTEHNGGISGSLNAGFVCFNWDEITTAKESLLLFDRPSCSRK